MEVRPSIVRAIVTSHPSIAMLRRYIYIYTHFLFNTSNDNTYVISEVNRLIFLIEQVTKRVDTSEEKWRDWNWRSEGDIMANGAFFVASGQGVEVKYEKAYSVEPKSAAYIDQLTLDAGVLGTRLLVLKKKYI